MKKKTVTKHYEVYGAVDILDEDGNLIRTFSENVHKKNYKKIADNFVKKQTKVHGVKVSTREKEFEIEVKNRK